ncbi:MAG: hypothetical protein WCT08_04555 [Patescibacteria group bacterium]
MRREKKLRGAGDSCHHKGGGIDGSFKGGGTGERRRHFGEGDGG